MLGAERWGWKKIKEEGVKARAPYSFGGHSGQLDNLLHLNLFPNYAHTN